MEISRTSKRVVRSIDYNCEHCATYWKELTKYWQKLGREMPGITLYCPACNGVHYETK